MSVRLRAYVVYFIGFACEGMTKMRDLNGANVGCIFSRCLVTSVGEFCGWVCLVHA